MRYYYLGMNTVETIQRKLIQLPPMAQEEVLGAVERIAERYTTNGDSIGDKNGEHVHALTAIASLAVDVGVTDLAERHDFYAHGKLEE